MLTNKTLEENRLENSEAFNKIMLESSPDCLKILDVEGRLQFMNFNGLCQMEIEDFSLFKNQVWWELWGEENKNLVKQSVETALQGKASEFSAFCPTAKGNPRWWHVTVTPVGSPTNGIYQLLSVSRDITIQKKAEDEIIALNNLLEEKVKIRTEELLEKNIQLEKTNAELATFNRIVSHDLQEPLRKIQMFSKLILDSEKNIDESHIYFNRILKSTDRMRDLIDAIHNFSISKHSKVIFENCDLNEVLMDITDYFSHIIEQKQATITIDKLPIVNASKILITQVIINILDNALKYSKNDIAPSIHIAAKVINSNEFQIPVATTSDSFYAITIKDNGIGFKDEYKYQIFEVFKRLHSKDEFLGTGIGLAICKTIIENHGGWIEGKSDINTGSQFTIYLPKK
jgi:PAS domain S-box-containing protein